MSDGAMMFITGFLLLAIGCYGLMITRDLLRMIVALQIMSKSVLLMIVAAGKTSGALALAQSLAVTVIAADTMMIVIGLALVIQIHRRTGTTDVRQLTNLKG